MEDGEIDGNKVTLDWAKPKGEGGFGGRGDMCHKVMGLDAMILVF